MRIQVRDQNLFTCKGVGVIRKKIFLYLLRESPLNGIVLGNLYDILRSSEEESSLEMK